MYYITTNWSKHIIIDLINTSKYKYLLVFIYLLSCVGIDLISWITYLQLFFLIIHYFFFYANVSELLLLRLNASNV